MLKKSRSLKDKIETQAEEDRKKRMRVKVDGKVSRSKRIKNSRKLVDNKKKNG